jgi:hypothetical protein
MWVEKSTLPGWNKVCEGQTADREDWLDMHIEEEHAEKAVDGDQHPS